MRSLQVCVSDGAGLLALWWLARGSGAGARDGSWCVFSREEWQECARDAPSSKGPKTANSSTSMVWNGNKALIFRRASKVVGHWHCAFVMLFCGLQLLWSVPWSSTKWSKLCPSNKAKGKYRVGICCAMVTKRGVTTTTDCFTTGCVQSPTPTIWLLSYRLAVLILWRYYL